MTIDRTEAGTTWSELARLDPLAAVLDPGDKIGAKNHAIDRVHKHALRTAVGSLPNARVIDFGCGTGRLSAWLVAHGATVEGVDVTPAMIDVARARRLEHARFTILSGPQLPFDDRTFDLAISAYVLQYYVREPAVAAELWRVIRPHGRLIAVEQVAEDDIGRGGTLSEYEDMLHAAGFSIVEARSIRASDSRVVGYVQRHRALSRLPLLPQLVELEARRLRAAPLTNGRYADVMFTCSRDDRDRRTG
jgi:ubiquinone/menaquinone biosynthesis C-methylase UbiE